MIYKREHFNNCQFNPFDDVDIDIGVDDQNLVKYIICLYDSNSPLIRGEQDLAQRKVKASEISGYEFHGYDDEIVMAIHRYLREHSKSMEWALLMALEESFWEYTMRMMKPIVDDGKETDTMKAISAKTKLAEDAKEFLDMYKSEFNKFYNNDKELIEVSGKIKKFRPEDVAKATQNVS